MNRLVWHLLFISLLILSEKAYSQTGTIKIEKPKQETAKPIKDTITNTGNSFDLLYGYKFFTQNFQNKFNTYQKFNINSPIQLIGFGESGPITINRYPKTYYGHSLLYIVAPQPLWINDTIKCKVGGFVYSLAFGGYINSKSKNFYTNFYFGFNTGRLRFYDNELVRQKNPFFSPKIGLQPKLHIKKFTITLIVEAEYDISKSNWRKTIPANNNKISIDRLKQTGYTALIGISYRIINYEENKDTRGGYSD